jgi:hypothetical protein
MEKWLVYVIMGIVSFLYLVGTLDFFFRVYHEEVTGEVLPPILIKMVKE